MYATTLGTRPLNFVFHRQMAVTNFTGDENQGIRLEQYCLKEVFMKLHGELIFLAVLNLFLAITALLGNTLILVALRRESSLSPQSKLLYRNLAITDFFVGIIVEPAYVVYLVSVVNKRHGICHYARVTCLIAAFVLCLVSLCTLTTISVERLLRLLLVRRYRSTNCHLQRNMYSCNRYLGFVRCRRINTILESFCNFSVVLYSFDSLWGHHNLLLLQNFFHSTSQSS